MEYSTLVNSFRCIYTYDSRGNRLTELIESWEYGTWTNYERYKYTYDSRGNRLTELSEVWKYGFSFIFRNKYTYDSHGNILTKLREDWISDAWINCERDTYTYDSHGNLLTWLHEDWISDALINYKRDTYTYDSRGNRLTWLDERWEDGGWELWNKIMYEYDVNDNCIKAVANNHYGHSYVSLYYNNMKSVIDIHDKYNIICEVSEASYVKIEDKKSVEDLNVDNVKIYSNGKGVNIYVDNDNEARFEIVDILGKVVMEGEFVLSTSVNISEKGIYIVRVTNDNGKLMSTDKVIIR